MDKNDNDGFTLVRNTKRQRTQSSPSVNTSSPDIQPLANQAATPNIRINNNKNSKIRSICLDHDPQSMNFVRQFKSECNPDYVEINNSRNKLIIRVETISDHEKLLKYAALKHQKYTIFNQQSDLPLRVVIRNIPSFTEVKEVKDELINLGFPVIEVKQMTAVITKKALPMFMVALRKEGNFESIYGVNLLCLTRVKVEDYKYSDSILQCYICQQFNHGTDSCRRDPACLHCAGPHDSRECTNKDGPVKCINCNGQHKAWDWKCPVRQEAEQIRAKRQQRYNDLHHSEPTHTNHNNKNINNKNTTATQNFTPRKQRLPNPPPPEPVAIDTPVAPQTPRKRAAPTKLTYPTPTKRRPSKQLYSQVTAPEPAVPSCAPPPPPPLIPPQLSAEEIEKAKQEAEEKKKRRAISEAALFAAIQLIRENHPEIPYYIVAEQLIKLSHLCRSTDEPADQLISNFVRSFISVQQPLNGSTD